MNSNLILPGRSARSMFTDDPAEIKAFQDFHANGGKVTDWMRRGWKIPVMAGGAPVAQPANYPLAIPTITGSTITVEQWLDTPTRITRFISDITREQFLLDKIFTSAGGVSGGALIYDFPTYNDLYLTRDFERVEPGGEFPVVASDFPTPLIATVEKWGAKTFITDEARDRNNSARFAMELRKMGNTITRKLNQRAIDALEAAITANGGASNYIGHDWTNVVTAGASQTNAPNWPAADFAAVQLMADNLELGVVYDLWVLNPADYNNLSLVYGPTLDATLRSFSISIYVSRRVTAGTAYVISQGNVGEYRLEKPLGTTTFREEKTERTWVQSSVRPLMVVTNAFGVVKVTGLQG